MTTENIKKAVAPTKREETPVLKITLGEEDLRPYFPDARTTIPDVKRGVLEALDLRKRPWNASRPRPRRKRTARERGREKVPFSGEVTP